MSKSTDETPLMLQYREVKARHRDAILFFRMGDFYEMFFDDAEQGVALLGITLTSRERGDGVPLAGVPVTGRRRLPAPAGRRGASGRDLRSGARTRSSPRASCAARWSRRSRRARCCRRDCSRARATTSWWRCREGGLAAIDLSTGEFALERVQADGLTDALERYSPLRGRRSVAMRRSTPGDRALRTPRERWEFDAALAREELARRFAVASLDGFGISKEDDAPSARPARCCVRRRTSSRAARRTCRGPRSGASDAHLWLDEMTRRNLELVGAARGRHRGTRPARRPRSHGSRRWAAGSCAVGARAPSRRRRRSTARSTRSTPARARPGAATRPARARSTACATSSGSRAGSAPAGGAARPAARCATRSLRLPDVLEVTALVGAPGASTALAAALDGSSTRCATSRSVLAACADGRPPPTLADGGVIQPGYDAELDELRELRDGGRAVIARSQAAGARAHRHRLAQGRLQPGLRLLPRGDQRAPRPGAGRLRPASRRSPAPSAT